VLTLVFAVYYPEKAGTLRLPNICRHAGPEKIIVTEIAYIYYLLFLDTSLSDMKHWNGDSKSKTILGNRRNKKLEGDNGTIGLHTFEV
jgi:hypothetical protein